MKIELKYDPVKPETLVFIDGKMTNRSDIYGFLYPVRHCLLQTWLMPSGSWSGLAWQLQELSRGEDMELVFCGRAEDFEDVQSALKDMDGLSLQLHQADPMKSYDELFEQMDSQIALMLDEHVQQHERKTLADLFPETARRIGNLRNAVPGDWKRMICSESDFRQADQEELCCCFVSEAYLDSYEKLEKLRDLTRSLRRSQDMICCCVEDAEKRADFAHYAAQYEDLRVRFDSEETCLPLLERKYGTAYRLRYKFRKYEEILTLLNQCYEPRETIKAKRTRLAKEKKKTVEQTRELECSKIILNWFDRKEPYLEKLNDLVYSGILKETQRKEWITDGNRVDDPGSAPGEKHSSAGMG